MAHVVEFEIEGLAGRPDVYRQKLNRDINVFFGPNGTGKTSLLRILHSAFEDDASLLRRTPFRRAEVKIFSVAADTVLTRRFERKPSRDAEVTVVSDETSALQPSVTFYRAMSGGYVLHEEEVVPWHTSYGKKPRKPMKGLAHVYLPTSRLYAGLPSRSRAWTATSVTSPVGPLEEDKLDDMSAALLEQRWRDYTASVLREVQAAQAQGLARILQAFLSAAPTSRGIKRSGAPPDLASAYERVRSFLSRQGSREHLGTLAEFTKRYERDSRLQQVVDDIDQVERTIAEAMAPRTRLQELVGRLFTGPKAVSFTDTAISVTLPKGPQIGLVNLSSGEKHLLRIMVDAMLAEKNSILIDEPDISMHVDWQTHFVELVRSVNPSCQLILATHSPEVTSLLSDSSLFHL